VRYIIKVDPRLRIEEPQKLPIMPEVVYLNGPITPETAAAVRQDLEVGESNAIAADQEILPLVIDSPGGDIYALLSIIDAMDACSLPIATVVEGRAFSAAAVGRAKTEGGDF